MRRHVFVGPARLCCAAAVSALLLAGCAGSGSSSKSAAGSAADRRAAPAVGAAEPATAPPKAGGLAEVKLPAGQAISYTADLQVRATNVTAAANQAKGYVLAAGGYVATETGMTDPPSASLSFEVPSARYTQVLGQLTDRLGTRLSLQQKSEDLTQQVADVDSRVKSAQATLDTFKKLLNRANTIGEVLNVEQEISTREADLESLQARQKALAQQTSYSTITLALQSRATSPVNKHHSGFTGGLSSGWDAFTAFLGGVAQVTGWLLPFAALAVVLGLPVLLIRRRRKAAATQ